jgi:3-oxoacyl-[acyl-carrier-protein] synthase I
MQINYLRVNRTQPIARALSNSFGFGGSNCALIFGRAG